MDLNALPMKFNRRSAESRIDPLGKDSKGNEGADAPAASKMDAARAGWLVSGKWAVNCWSNGLWRETDEPNSCVKSED